MVKVQQDRRRRRYDRDGARYVARKLAVSLRRKGHPKPYPGVAFVRELMRRQAVESTQMHKMCIKLRNPAIGYTLDNAVLVAGNDRLIINKT